MRREHIASPRSPPGRGYAEDSGRRSGNQFYGGRSVQKGELEFKPMFNKKNIAKLLVFAMILTMLPVSVGAGSGSQNSRTTSQSVANDYVTVSDVKATIEGYSYELAADTSKDGSSFTDAYVFETDAKTKSNAERLVSFMATAKNGSIYGVYVVTNDAESFDGLYVVKADTDTSKGYVYSVGSDVTEVAFCIATQASDATKKSVTTEKMYIKVKLPKKDDSPAGAESTYTITPDSSNASEMNTNAEITLSSNVTYKVGEDTAKPVTGGKAVWSADPSDYVTLSDTSDLSKGTASVKVTSNTKEGKVKITLNYYKIESDTETAATKDFEIEIKKTDTGDKEGTYTITVDSAVTVTVGEEPTTVTATVEYTVEGDATPKKVTAGIVAWSIPANDPYVTLSDAQTTVNANGETTVKVAGVAKGATELTLSYTKPGATEITKTASTTVTVEETGDKVAVTGVELNKESVSLFEGKTEQLTATVKPTDATDQSVSWKSDNTEIATVSETGLVSAVKAGTAKITVTTTDGGYTATCDVTVSAASATADGYTITADASNTLTVKVKEKITLTANVTYEVDGDAVPVTAGNVKWAADPSAYVTLKDTSDLSKGIASVEVTGKKAGTVKITLSYTKPDGEEVTVEYPFTITVEDDGETPPEPDKYVVTAAEVNGGEIIIDPNDDGSYEFAEDTDIVSFTVKANDGYAYKAGSAYAITADSVKLELNPQADGTETTTTFTFTMPGSNVTISAVFEPVTPKDVTTSWKGPEDGIDNPGGGLVTVEGVVPGKSYVFTLTTVGASGEEVSAYVCKVADSSKIEVPCGFGTKLEVTECENSTAGAFNSGDVIAEGTMDYNWSTVYERAAQEVQSVATLTDHVPSSDAGFVRESGQTTSWLSPEDGIDNPGGGLIVLEGAVPGKCYVFTLTTVGASGEEVSAYVCEIANSSRIEVPCGYGTRLEVTECEDSTAGAFNSGDVIAEGTMEQGFVYPQQT